MIVVEFETIGALGQARTIQITKEGHQMWLEIHSRNGLEAMAKLPDNFFQRCRVHNVEDGLNRGLIL